jgi:hypothetical protein
MQHEDRQGDLLGDNAAQRVYNRSEFWTTKYHGVAFEHISTYAQVLDFIVLRLNDCLELRDKPSLPSSVTSSSSSPSSSSTTVSTSHTSGS